METILRTFGAERVGADVVLVHPTRADGRPWRTLWLTLAAVAWVLRLPARTPVHVHLSERGSFIREGLVVALASARKLPVVVTNHGADFIEFATAHPRLVGAVLRRADVVLSNYDESLQLTSRLAPGSEHRIVFNPMPADSEAGPADATDELVLFAGEIGTRKGADVLARAWELLSARRPNARLVMVGPATDLRVAPQPRLTVGSPVPREEVRRMIREARVVVLPTQHEALPMLLIEARAGGRPFVSTPVAGIPNLAGGVQALVPVGDHQALADELELLLADPDLARERGDAGLEMHARTSSVEAVGRAMREVYLLALERRSSGGRAAAAAAELSVDRDDAAAPEPG